MSKINVLGVQRREYPVQTGSFTDPDAPGETLTLSVRKLDLAQALVARDLADERIAEFVTGENGKAPNAYAPLGRHVKLSKSLVERLTTLEVMQCGPAEERYSFDELALLSVVMPNAVTEAIIWGTDIQYEGETTSEEASEGNSAAEDGKSCSKPPSSTTTRTRKS